MSRSFSPSLTQCVIKLHEEHHALEDYQGGVPRWCNGCGDNAILAAMQRLCSEEKLAPENTVFVSGIGCSSRLPHYMKTRSTTFHRSSRVCSVPYSSSTRQPSPTSREANAFQSASV
jgi:hypothetical protein